MKRFYNLLYSKASRFVLGNKLSIFSDIVILSASGYLLIKKAFDFSISGWLINNALHQPAVNAYVYFSGFVVVIAITIKVLSLIFENFPVSKHAAVEPEEISACLQAMNHEIKNHIDKCDSSSTPNIRRLKEQHSFDINTRLIANSLAENIRKSLGSIKIKRKDLFISLYSFNENENTLEYELHYDEKRDLVRSKIIYLAVDKFQKYEAVKCMNSTDCTTYLIDKNLYYRGKSKRYKTFCQYMGCKLESNSEVFGFLNIEFHNHELFMDEDEMQDFMEENIFPFKLLLEYQYLKKQFFGKFENLEDHWEVA